MDVKVFIANSTDPSKKQRKFDLLIEKMVAYLFYFFFLHVKFIQKVFMHPALEVPCRF